MSVSGLQPWKAQGIMCLRPLSFLTINRTKADGPTDCTVYRFFGSSLNLCACRREITFSCPWNEKKTFYTFLPLIHIFKLTYIYICISIYIYFAFLVTINMSFIKQINYSYILICYLFHFAYPWDVYIFDFYTVYTYRFFHVFPISNLEFTRNLQRSDGVHAFADHRTDRHRPRVVVPPQKEGTKEDEGRKEGKKKRKGFSKRRKRRKTSERQWGRKTKTKKRRDEKRFWKMSKQLRFPARKEKMSASTRRRCGRCGGMIDMMYQCIIYTYLTIYALVKSMWKT